MAKTEPEQTLGQQVVEMLEQECEELGITLTDLCNEADVNRSIPARWKDGSTVSPLLETYFRLTRSLKKLRKEAAAA